MASSLNKTNRDRLVRCLKTEAKATQGAFFNIHTYADNFEHPEVMREANSLLRFNCIEDLHTKGSTACILGTWNTYHPDEMLDVFTMQQRRALAPIDPGSEMSGGVILAFHWLGLGEGETLALLGFGDVESRYGVASPSIFRVIEVLEGLE